MCRNFGMAQTRLRQSVKLYETPNQACFWSGGQICVTPKFVGPKSGLESYCKISWKLEIFTRKHLHKKLFLI